MWRTKINQTILNWTNQIISDNLDIIYLASRRRSKFEGWLKYELARKLYQGGASDVFIEYSDNNIKRCDLSFSMNEQRYYIELKTPNSNWRIDEVENLTRPITHNRQGIIKDIDKIRTANINTGIICFVLFPIPIGHPGGANFVNLIAEQTNQEIHEHNYSMINIHPTYDVLACAITVNL